MSFPLNVTIKANPKSKKHKPLRSTQNAAVVVEAASNSSPNSFNRTPYINLPRDRVPVGLFDQDATETTVAVGTKEQRSTKVANAGVSVTPYNNRIVNKTSI